MVRWPHQGAAGDVNWRSWEGKMRMRGKLTYQGRALQEGRVFISMLLLGVMWWLLLPPKTAHDKESALNIYWGQRAVKPGNKSHSSQSFLYLSALPSSRPGKQEAAHCPRGRGNKKLTTSNPLPIATSPLEWGRSREEEKLIIFMVWAKT